jgi:hypothetical protein
MDSVTIVNMALGKIGQEPISSLTEGSAAANAANLVYDSCRRAVLEAFPWSFATKSAQLNRLVSAPPDYLFAYAMPSDCIHAIRVQNASMYGGDRSGFLVRGDAVLSNSPAVTLEYVADVTDPNRFEARFIEALVLRLASELAMPVGAKAELAFRYRDEYEAIVRQSAGKSASQFYEELDDNPFLSARL